MKLVVRRRWKTPHSTCGELSIDGNFFCYTLERPLPDSGGDAPFCIPPGTYKINMVQSEHFNRVVPLLIGVPGRDGIEIHPGNFPKDTHGCILVGENHITDMVERSQAAFLSLMSRLMTSQDGWEIEVE